MAKYPGFVGLQLLEGQLLDWLWNVLPRLALRDVRNGLNTDSESGRDHAQAKPRHSKFSDIRYICIGQFGSMMLFAARHLRGLSAHVVGVLVINGRCHVFEIGRSVVKFLAVLVINSHSNRTWTDKRTRHESVNLKHGRFTISAQIDSEVAASYRRWSQECWWGLSESIARSRAMDISGQSFHAPFVADFIEYFIPYNWTPFLYNHDVESYSIHSALASGT